MKAVVALLAAAILVLLGFGGYYYYQNYVRLGAAAEVDAAQSEASAPVKTVTGGAKKKPLNEADAMDNLDAAMLMNEDAVAWLRIPGTNINDSVLQGLDNHYYLRRDEEKKDSIYGCYFADFECPFGTREDFAGNTVIYGHSDLTDNADGPRFSELFRFTELEFAQKTPYLYLTTPEGPSRWQVFAAFYTDVGLDYIRVRLAPEGVAALAAEARRLSVYDYGVETGPEDKLLTLSTCSVKNGADGSQRFVVMARLLPEDAAEQESVTLAKNGEG